jgi:Tfp pilus assembly protein PilX
MALKQQKDAVGRDIWVDESNNAFTEGGSRATNYSLDAWNQRQLGNQQSGNTSFSTPQSELSNLEKELAKRQKSVEKATAGINDNPWYSEATRVGKLGRLDEQSQMAIANLQNQINQKRADQQLQFQMQQANQPNISSYTDVNGNLIGINSQTGQQVYSRPGAGVPYKPAPTPNPGLYLDEDGQPTGTPQTNSQVLNSPPFSMPAGTQGIEYPVGSGNYWDVGPDGRWM